MIYHWNGLRSSAQPQWDNRSGNRPSAHGASSRRGDLLTVICHADCQHSATAESTFSVTGALTSEHARHQMPSILTAL